MGLVVGAGALRPLPNGDGGGGGRERTGGRERAGGRELLLLHVGEEGDVAALHQRLEGGRGLEGDKVLGPDEVGHLGRRVLAFSNNKKMSKAASLKTVLRNCNYLLRFRFRLLTSYSYSSGSGSGSVSRSYPKNKQVESFLKGKIDLLSSG